jgi:D-serine deaminase-like pyridoxal phosphate-dependent protein
MKARFPEVDTPALLLDLDRVERNLERYQRAADAAGLNLRPHTKAHKTAQLSRLQLAQGAIGLCCAKLAEAEALAAQGLETFLITTPVIGAGKIRRLVELARRTRVMVVVDGEENVAELAKTGVALDVLVDVDVGQGRTGVVPGAAAAKLAAAVARHSNLRFRGLQTYQGKLQGVVALDERTALVREAMAKLAESERAVREAGFAVEIRTGGGTGSFPIDLELRALTELQPGSYVTMDTNYAKVKLGGGEDPPSGNVLGNPLTILTSVVSRPVPDRAVVDAGWKSASSDSGTPALADADGHTFEFAGDEHGILRRGGAPVEVAPGDKVQLIPSHCDTTVNLYDSFVIHRSGKVIESWPIVGRGKAQ